MKPLLTALALTAALGLATPAFAAEHGHDHSVAAPAGDELPWVDAIVRKIDVAGGKLMLSHGPIPNLNMAGMTMSFRVRDMALLEQLKPADKVRVAIDDLDGKLTVMKLERAAK